MTIPALLSGITVLDLTQLLPGPLCTLQLQGLGARVIKIEPPGGDYASTVPPIAKKASYLYLQLNEGKEIRRLDLKSKEGREAFLELVSKAQVVVESMRPGVMEKLGLDYRTLIGHAPSLVYCSITGYGQSGPYRDFAGHDINYLAISGVLDQMEGLSNLPFADVAGGSLPASLGILAALLDSQRTGNAHYLDISMLDGILSLNQVALASLQGRGKDPVPGADLLSGAFPFYNLYQTSDKRKVALGALEAKFWTNFCRAIDRPEWEDLHSSAPENWKEIRQELSDLFLTKTMREWEALLKDKDCCLSPVLTPSEALEDPQVRARKMLRQCKDPNEGEFLALRGPIIMDKNKEN